MPEVDITWLTLTGEGGGRGPDGRVYQVFGAIVGDTVTCEPSGRPRGKVVPAVLSAIRTPSADRRPAPCPHADRCGGCDLGHVQPAARRASLAQAVGRALRVTTPEVTHDGGGRARIKLAVRDGDIGYLQPQSHGLAPVQTCRVARPEVADAIEQLRPWVRAHSVASSSVDAIEIRSDGSRVVFAVAARPSASKADRAALGAALASLGDVAVDGSPVQGDPTLWLDVGPLTVRASPHAFYQVDLELNRALVEHVTDKVVAAAPERLLDLYAGIGNLTLPTARATGAPVVAVENNSAATADLRAGAERAGLAVQVVTADVQAYDPGREAFDVAIVDPPRRGCGPALEALLACRPRYVVYVSCNPGGLVRDVRTAQRHGYELDSAHCFDLFPDTHHIETVVGLVRGRKGQRVRRR